MRKRIVPKDKGDDEAIENLLNSSFDEIRDEIPALLEWLQDMNWPVAGGVFDFLLPHVNEIEAEIIKIFHTNDGIWKYWILGLIYHFPGKISNRMLEEVKRIAEHPTYDEVEEGAQEKAIDVIRKLKSKGFYIL